jgi:hypothetical protein
MTDFQQAFTEMYSVYKNLNSSNEEKEEARNKFQKEFEKTHIHNPSIVLRNPEYSRLTPLEALKKAAKKAANTIITEIERNKAHSKLRSTHLNLNGSIEDRQTARNKYYNAALAYESLNPQLSHDPKLIPSEYYKMSIDGEVGAFIEQRLIKSSNLFFTDYATKRKNRGTNSNKLETYGQMKDKIIEQESQITKLQSKVQELEEKMRNNSNAGSVSTAQTFVTANSSGGKRKTQKKRRL